MIFLSVFPATPFLPETVAADRFDANPQTSASELPQKVTVHLYFSDLENTFLFTEERTLLHSYDPAEFAQIIIENLIQGPRENLMRTIPVGTAVRAVYVAEDKTAYVDTTAALKDAHPGGIQSELMTIFSIVNSLILNIPDIKTVKILIDGHESTTLAGHLDLRFPFKADMLLTR